MHKQITESKYKLNTSTNPKFTFKNENRVEKVIEWVCRYVVELFRV